MRFIRLAIALAALIGLFGGTPAFAQASAPPATWSVSDCQTCHEQALGPAFAHSKHAQADLSCANCHVNVGEHAKAKMAGESGGPSPSLKKLAANDLSAKCLTCHEKGNQANFVTSMHSRRSVACIACHSVHSSKSTKALLKTKTDTDTCFTCHKSERAMSMRTSHHPVREGKMGCVSCHNPHDGSRPKMLQADTVNELCYKCHTEKRGPFLFEHAPVREECVTCHEPHGSNHERLLRAKMPFLCQRCHYSGHGITGDLSNTQAGVPLAPVISGVPAQTTRSAREMERACKQCHLAIHGSNSPSGHFFVR